MNTIYLIRHSISEGNENNIIQGNIDYSLSKNGKELLKKVNYTQIKKTKKIYSSPYKRAYETSKIIKQKINANCPIDLDEDLIEKQAGILNGKSKEYLKKYKKEYLNIYLKRGDYDEIPNAEKWKYTQARVLSFLEKYIDKNDEKDIVVTHAAFMRMFLNTINFEYRNTQKELPNACLYVINNPLDKLKIKKYEIAKSSEVYKISTYDNDYILKKTNKNLTHYDFSLNRLLNFLSNYIIVPNPIYISNKKGYCIKIYDYIEGKHKFGELDEKNKINLIKEVYKLSELLNNYDNNDNFAIRDIISDMFRMKKELKNDKYIKLVDKLIDDNELNRYLDNAKYVLVHNDLHRYNIIFNKDQIGFLDFDGLKLCPKLLQPASFIATCFLLENDSIEIEGILKYWPEKVDTKIVKKLIIYRLLYGLSFFEKETSYNTTDQKIREKYIKAIERMI